MTKKDDGDLVGINVPNVPRWLREEAQVKAKREGRPLAEILREMIREWVEGERPERKE